MTKRPDLTAADVSTDEMLAWLDLIVEIGDGPEWSEIDGYDAAIARAIAERLRRLEEGR